jgi:type IV fimbrial biogenesis protein FimT
VIAVLGISLAAAYPSFRTAIQNNRLTTQSNDITTMVTLARAEAVRASLPVTVCAGTETECTGELSDGLTVAFGALEIGDGVSDYIQHLPGPQFSADFSTNEFLIQFGASGFVQNGPIADFSMQIEDCKGEQRRNFQVPFSGRIRATKSVCS